MHDFISCIGHLKNIGLLSYEDLPLNNTFHFTTLEKKSHLLMSPLISSEKVLCIRKLRSSKYAYKFSKIPNFCMKVRFLLLATITVNCLPWNDRLTLFIFEKLNAQLQITIACLEAIEMMFHGGKKYLVPRKQFHKCFTLKHPSYISIGLLLFSHSVMSNSLWTHGPQHSRLPCSPPSPRVCSDLCPLSWWCQYITELLMSTFYFVKKKMHLKDQYLVKWITFNGHY